eukprot:SAG31_NODE_7997_length_1544_cov_2.191696_1_plen_83_part_10
MKFCATPCDVDGYGHILDYNVTSSVSPFAKLLKLGGVCGEVPTLYYIFFYSMDIDTTTADRNSCVPDPWTSDLKINSDSSML